jgi:mono/diheme cytochrome c family protein
MMTIAVVVASALWLSAVTTAVRAQVPADADDTKIWAGIFTDAQATRGKSVYEAYCTRCHGLNLLGGRQGGVGGPALKDANFWVSWERAPLSALFGTIQRTMPQDSPASLRQDDYIDVLAYMLAENKFPSGTADLPANGLETVRIARRAGEATEVPDFALVQVVGCLTAGPNKTWALSRATAPLLTRDETPSAASLATAASQPPGSAQVRLVGATPFKPETSVGQRVEARGLLSKGTGDSSNRIDVLSLKPLGASCTM